MGRRELEPASAVPLAEMKLGLNMEESLGMDGFLRARGLGRSCSIGALAIDIGELLRWSVWI